MIQQGLQQNGRALVVGGDIAVDLIHALADTNLGGQVDDRVHALQRPPDLARVADVADQQFHVRRAGGGCPARMDLIQQIIQNADLVALRQQGPADMGPDEIRHRR